MFEKEAEERTEEKYTCNEKPIMSLEAIGYKKGYKDGAEFGYNKANEWRYPSKGELPKENTTEKETLYLLLFGLGDSDCMTGVFSHGRFWCIDSGWLETDEVIAWKEIVLPELKESK